MTQKETNYLNMGLSRKGFSCEIDNYSLVKKIDAVRNAANLAHEIKRLYCNAIGIESEEPWAKLKYTQRETVTDRVMDIIEKGDMSPKEFHERWVNRKKKCGWKHGPVFSRTAMTDPFVDAWDSLPMQVRMIDTLFVDCVSGYLASIMYPEENATKEGYDIDLLIEDTDAMLFKKIENCVSEYPYFLGVLVKKLEDAGVDVKPVNRSSKRAFAKRIIRACIQDSSILNKVIDVLSL